MPEPLDGHLVSTGRVADGVYRITTRGRLGDRFAHAFRGMTPTEGHGDTILVGPIEDQSHLFGILDRIQVLGLDLVSVEPSHDRGDG